MIKKQPVYNYGSDDKMEYSIESYYLKAKEDHNIFDAELLSLDTTGHVPAPGMLSVVALKYCKLWVIEQRKRPQVTSTFSKLVQDNNVQVNLCTMKNLTTGQVIVPMGGSIDEIFLQRINRIAREVANILVLHTTHTGEKAEEWITVAKAQQIGIPYLDLVYLRNKLGIRGGNNFITRDALFQSLSFDGDESKMNLLHTCNSIFSTPLLRSYAEKDDRMLAFYIKNQPSFPKLPVLDAIWLPKMSDCSYKVPRVEESIWKISIYSGQILGESRRRGVISAGYYRFDLPPSEIHLFNEVSDILMLCAKYEYKAVTCVNYNINLFQILNANDITVYNSRVMVRQPDGKVGGVWSFGSIPSFQWGYWKPIAPQVSNGSVKHSPVLIYPEGCPLFFNYCYIPQVADANLTYFPSMNAADGLCIASNIKHREGVPIDRLLIRFARAQIFRNWFPYTRLSYISQDPYAKWFPEKWLYPKKRDKGVEDLFADSEIFSAQLVLTEAEKKIYSSIGAVEFEAPPKEDLPAKVEKSLGLCSGPDIVRWYKLFMTGVPEDRKNMGEPMDSLVAAVPHLVIMGYLSRVIKEQNLLKEEEEDPPEDDEQDSQDGDNQQNENSNDQEEDNTQEKKVDEDEGLWDDQENYNQSSV